MFLHTNYPYSLGLVIHTATCLYLLALLTATSSHCCNPWAVSVAEDNSEGVSAGLWISAAVSIDCLVD